MGMLAKAGAAHEEPAKEAKKKEQKKKAEVPDPGKPQATHAGKGPPPAESSSHPGLESESDGRSNPSESDDQSGGEAEDSDPNTPAGDSEADGSDDGGGDVDSPQPGQDQEAQGADEGGDAGDAEQGAGQDASPQSAGDDSAPDADAGQDQGQGQSQGDFNIADLAKMPIPPALKEEYIKANAALMTALYQNDKVAQAVLQGIVPQGIHKIESVVHMSLTLFFQINKQLNFMQDAKQISMAFLNQVIAHVVDLATQVKQIPFSDKEVSAAVSAGQEMLMRIHGVTKGQMKAVAQHIPKSELQAQLSKYQQHTRDVHNVTGRFNQQAGGPPGGPPQGGAPGGPPQAGGAPGAAPPQGGAPATAGPTGGAGGTPGGQPQPGAPVTAAPGQGQSAPPGGMLSQAANQPPGQ
jgi:hypothetical protein